MASMDDLKCGTQQDWVDEAVATVAGPNAGPEVVEVVSDWVDAKVSALDVRSGRVHDRERLAWSLYDVVMRVRGHELVELLVELREARR